MLINSLKSNLNSWAGLVMASTLDSIFMGQEVPLKLESVGPERCHLFCMG